MIPLLKIPEQYQQLKAEIEPAVMEVLASGRYALGPQVEAFERDFAVYCGAAETVAVNSGTSALHLALVAAGVGPGDEVITVAHTFVATVAAILYAGATPVLVDIDPESYTMDPECLEAALSPRTRAVLPVHLYGQPADMDPILEFARKHDLLVIEDAAQAHGAEYKGRRAGGLALAGCFSFYPGKNLGACGEGGAVTTNDAELAAKMRQLRDWGQAGKYNHVMKGFNYRMDGIQGAVLGVKLRHMEAWNEARRVRAEWYAEGLQDTPISPPKEMPYSKHVYHVFTLRVPERAAFQAVLAERKIQTATHYPVPVHLQPAYSDLGYGPGALPHTEEVAKEVVSLPLYPELSRDEVDEVLSAVKAFAG